MFVNERVKPENLLVMESLHHRWELTWAQEQYYLYQVRGYEGELLFDEFLRLIEETSTIFANIMLHQSGTDFELDTMVARGWELRLYDVKNHQGEFYYEEGKIVSESGRRVQNPFGKVDRAEALLTNFLARHNLPYQVKAYVVYINEEHTMHQAPKKERIIYRSQIKKHLEDFARQHQDTFHDHTRLINVLMENKLPGIRSKDIPEYDFEGMRKGFWCPECGSFDFHQTRQNLKCHSCNEETSIQSAIVRNAKEFQLLFPNEKLTTSRVHEWCGEGYSVQRINYALTNNLVKIGNNKGTHYQ